MVFVHNFTDTRARINITVDGVQKYKNNSILTGNGMEASWQTGMYVAYNDSTGRDFKELRFIINGKGT